MEEQFLNLIKELGTGGLDAFYLYLILDYVSIWILIGLSTWGIRTVWNKAKDDL